MWPSLSTGAINRILNREDVPTPPVFQILGCKEIPVPGSDHYRLLISDGVTRCPFAMLAPKLSRMARNKEVEKFTIVRVDKHELYQVQADHKVIILLNLTVLAAGNEVNEKLGNPIMSSITGSSPETAIAPAEPATNGKTHQQSMDEVPQVTTTGCHYCHHCRTRPVPVELTSNDREYQPSA